MEFYLRWLDKHERKAGEDTPLGIILCTGNNSEQIERARSPYASATTLDVYYNDCIKEGLEFMSATATRSEVARFQLHHGDVLVTKDSESWDDIAVPAYIAEELDGVLCGYHLAHIRPDLRKLIGEYLFRAFRSSGINDQFRVAANGITRFGLGKYWLDNGLFPVPPPDEQKAIAAFLDRETARIDALIEKKQRRQAWLHEDLIECEAEPLDFVGSARTDDDSQGVGREIGSNVHTGT